MSRLKKGVVRPLQKRILYIASAILWLSGTIWLYLRYFTQTHDEFGPLSHPAQTMLLEIHGAAAMAFLIIFGAVLFHVKPGWLQKRQRPSGLLLIVSCAILIITGWGLYYLGNEHDRDLTSSIHSVLGFLMPVIIFFHVWRIVRQKKCLPGSRP